MNIRRDSENIFVCTFLGGFLLEAKNIPTIEDNLELQESSYELLANEIKSADAKLADIENQSIDQTVKIELEVVEKFAYAVADNDDTHLFLDRQFAGWEKKIILLLSTSLISFFIGAGLSFGLLNGTLDISKSEIKSIMKEIKSYIP